MNIHTKVSQSWLQINNNKVYRARLLLAIYKHP